jgi:toxin ParE1/3/4
MKFSVSFRPEAESDLFNLYDYIADEAGPVVAGGYIDRIEEACMTLATFPERGTGREDIRPGLRTVGFERRATIVFQVVEREVVIVRVLYGGRDADRILQRIGED